MKFWKDIIIIVIIFIAAYFIVDIGRYFFYPNVSYLKKNRPGKTAFMEYREETWHKKRINKSINTVWVPLSEISPYAVKAVILAEDDNFWSHDGFDFNAIQNSGKI